MKEKPLKLSQIAKELDLAVQEISRQLARLTKMSLVMKNVDGAYIVTPQGRNLLRLIPGFSFLSINKSYLEKKSLDNLPDVFMNRIGELHEFSPVPNLLDTFISVERMMQEADEFFWYITDENLVYPNAYNIGSEALKRGVEMKCIEPVDYAPPEELTLKVSEEARDVIVEYRKKGQIRDVVLDKIDVFMYMNEKEVGVLGFPDSEGNFDYLGFTSKDPNFVKWCKDLHEYYWKIGKPREEYYIKTE